MGLSDRERAGLSPAEAEAFDDSEDADVVAMRLLADKLDTDDDDDAKSSAGAEVEKDGGAAEAGAAGSEAGKGDAATGGGADGAQGKDDKTATDDDTPKVPEPFAPKLSGPGLDDYQQQRGQLLDERKALRKSLRDGDITQDQCDEKLDDLNDRISRLDTQHALDQQAVENNKSTLKQQWEFTVSSFKEAMKASGGIDYDANPAAEAVWDRYVRILASDEKNADKSDPRWFQWFLSEAHKMAMKEIRRTAEMLGMAPAKDSTADAAGKGAATTAAGKEAVKNAIDARRPKLDQDAAGTRPLNNLPASGGADDGGGGSEFAHLASLSGMKLERAIAAMTLEQQQRYLESQE